MTAPNLQYLPKPKLPLLRTFSVSSMAMALLLFSALFLFVTMSPGMNLYDEGLIAFGARRVELGDLPYKDFWTMYGPGEFYLTATLYRLFGVSDLTLRICDIIFKSLIVYLSYVSIVRFGSTMIATIGAVAVLIFLCSLHNYGFPIFPAVALSLLSILLFTYDTLALNMFCAGLATGLSTLFRHDLGFYTLVSCMLCSLLSTNDDDEIIFHLKYSYRMNFLYLVGVSLVVVPTLVLLASYIDLSDLYENLIKIPSVVYPKVRSLPFPKFDELKAAIHQHSIILEFAVYIPFIVVTGSVLTLIIRAAHRGTKVAALGRSNMKFFILINLLSSFFILKGAVRVSILHFSPSIILSLITIAILASILSINLTRSPLSSVAVLACLLISIIPATQAVETIAKQMIANFNGPNGLLDRCSSPLLPRLRCVSVAQDMLQTVRYVDEHSSPDEAIFVGDGRHDRLFANNISFYFAAERQSVTKWHDLHPGVQTTVAKQQYIVNELQSSHLKMIVLDREYDNLQEPNESSQSSGVTILDDFIAENFQSVFQLGFYTVLMRKTT